MLCYNLLCKLDLFMLANYFPFLIGILAGVHAGSYGAYKDSPYEGFMLRRVVRELVIASSIGLLLSVYFVEWIRGEEYFVIFLVIFAGSRCVTEFYKLFIRVESQKLYTIPTQIHFFGRVSNSRVKRLLAGGLTVLFFALICIFGEYALAGLLNLFKGLVLGLLMGLATAIAGSYKDGFFEGFDGVKFLRSPSLGLIGGVFVSVFTSNVLFLILGSVGFERVVVELYKAFLKKGYWPGKFGAGKVRHKEWMEKRNVFVPLYFFTLFFLVWLFIAAVV